MVSFIGAFAAELAATCAYRNTELLHKRLDSIKVQRRSCPFHVEANSDFT